MMNLLLSAFSEFPNNDTGGANKIIYQILRGIDYSKYSVDYLSKNLFKNFTKPEDLNSQINSSLSTKKKLGRFMFYNFSFYRNIVLSSWYFSKNLKATNRFYENLRLDKEYDVLHAHDTRSMYYLKKIKDKKKILTIHSDGSIVNTLQNYLGDSSISKDIMNKYLLYENESLKIADVITFPSQAARDLFLEEKAEIGIDLNKIKVVYNGIDTQFIDNINVDENFKKKYFLPEDFDVIIFNAASHISIKNIDIVIDTVYHLKKKYNIRALLLNAGSGPNTTKLLTKIRSLNLNSQVRFLGRVPSIEIIKLLKSADILISAAERVVFDMIILEALMAGSVIIASNRGGNSEAIIDGVNGYLVDELNGERFADAIMCIDRNVSSNARKSALRFDLLKMVLGFENLYTN
ncbi:MAG: glycosyltransferase family 4 protein [Ignavibacteriaceae bacterium]|nr:glycosyltransferase family 4 protein [Ignavibacteriaceae bacterium]